jgi:hypothetical protein
VAGDVTDDHAEPAAGEGEHVVPVAADTRVVAGYVAGGDVDAGRVRQAARQQAALQGEGGGPVDAGRPRLCGDAGPVGGQLEQADVVGRELARSATADVQDADDLARGEHRHAEQ